MPSERTIRVEPLTPSRFAPYGQAILKPSDAPTSAGEGWQCWFGVGALSAPGLRLGQVVTRRGDGCVRAMERHPDEEFLLPIDGPIVQVVAIPGDLANPKDQPDANQVAAFRLEPGEAVVIAPGVWHAAAMPVAEQSLYYFAALPHPPEPGRDDPWIPFRRGETLSVG